MYKYIIFFGVMSLRSIIRGAKTLRGRSGTGTWGLRLGIGYWAQAGGLGQGEAYGEGLGLLIPGLGS